MKAVIDSAVIHRQRDRVPLASDSLINRGLCKFTHDPKPSRVRFRVSLHTIIHVFALVLLILVLILSYARGVGWVSK